MNRVKLIDVCDFQGGSQPPKSEWLSAPKEGYVRMLQIRDFTQSRNVENEYIKLTNKTKLCSEDDILIARYGASIGKILTGLNGAYNVAIMKTIPDTSKLLKKYLFYYLLSDTFQTFICNVGSRAAQAGFNKDELSGLYINLPQLSMQKQIADNLDKVTHIIDLCNAILEKLDLLVKSRFVEMFGNPVHNSLHLPVLPMTDVCEIIDGDRGKNYPKQEEFYDDEYCLFLNAKNVTKNGFDFSDCMFITKEKDDSLRKGKLIRGDVVLTTRGTLGNLAFYTDAVPFENIRINSGMVILRMNKKIIDEVFFIEQFRMQVDDIKHSIASGSAQPQLPISTMNKINIIMPDLTEQKIFAAFVSQVDKSKSAVKQVLAKAEILKNALMQEYFG